ncbi:GH16700 [Drosophila grimshawi]|uniref:GH16700 n=1 Tax=Drosophila grimshawi TaxID=7222 RepID=B4J316_DROGR|nr:GH16700 [Drosophila grimshawi]
MPSHFSIDDASDFDSQFRPEVRVHGQNVSCECDDDDDDDDEDEDEESTAHFLFGTAFDSACQCAFE